MKYEKLGIFIFFMLGFNVIRAAHPSFKKNIVDKDWNFVQNKGQIDASEEIKYYGHLGNVYLFCKSGKLSFVFTKVEKSPEQISECDGKHTSAVFQHIPLNEKARITTNHIDLVLVNSNRSAHVIPSNEQVYYENFYGENIPEGITNVHTYKTLTYKSIYPNIDFVLYAKPEGMKYEFVVWPGGDLRNIQIEWNGLQNILMLKNGGVEYSCDFAKMSESKPVSFQGKTFIQSRFFKNKNRIGFKVGHYDKKSPLVIDPTLFWATYLWGATSFDIGNKITIDNSHCVFIVGTTFSSSDIASTGAYQTSLGGYSDAFLSKFNISGSRAWTTYYGGNKTEVAMGISADTAGNIFIGGYTASSSGIASSGAYQTNRGNENGFVAKFSSQGSRVWASYLNGIGYDCNAITTDAFGSVIVTGDGGGVFVAKFTASGKLAWSTNYGGNSTSNGIATDAAGNIYIVGSTNGDTGIATQGAYQTSYGGGYGAGIGNDAIVAKFSTAGKLIWGTYFGGDGIDGGEAIATDKAGNIMITGETNSTNGISSSGAYETNPPINADFSGFIAKFSTLGNRLWATYCNNVTTNAIATDTSNNIYIVGSASNIKGITTPGAYQTNYGGGDSDIYIAKFSSGGNFNWGTWFGGKGNDNGTSIAIDDSANIYITGTTTSNEAIATSGAFQSTNSGLQDGFIAKFGSLFFHDICISGFLGLQDSLCPGQNMPVIIKIENFGSDTSVSITIHWTINAHTQDSVLWTGIILPDSIQLINIGSPYFLQESDSIVAWVTMNNGIDPVKNNDTGRIIVHVFNVHFPTPGQSSYSICSGTHIKIGTNAQPNYTYLWSSIPFGFSSTLPDPVVNPGKNTSYNLTVTDTITGCTSTNSTDVLVSLLPAPVVNAGKNQSICFGDSVRIGSSPLSGDSYSWLSDPAGYSTTIADPIVSPGSTVSYLLTVTNKQGCTNFDSVIIIVNPRPHAVAGTSQSICSGTVIQLGTSKIPGQTYSWTSKPIGYLSNLWNPIDSPKITTEYRLKQTIPATGCADSDSIRITVLPRPDVQFDSKYIGGYEYQFTTNNPNYPAYQYHWYVEDNSGKIMDTLSGYNISYIFSQNGNYNVILKVGLPGYCTVIDSNVLDINESFLLNIFPNPFDLKTGIQYTLINTAHVKISLVDEVGRQVGTLIDQQQNSGEYNLKYDGAAWETRSGMYFIVFQLDDRLIIKKIIQLDSVFN